MIFQNVKSTILKGSGFITLEIVIATGLFVLLCTVLQIPYGALQSKIYPMQLQAAAQTFAADIRAFQQETLFSNSSSNRIVILSDKSGYYIESDRQPGKRYIFFNKVGCEGVYFSKTSSNYIRFSNNGAPFTAGTYVLKHNKLTKSCTLTIQVASGRVDISEQ